MTTPTTPAEGTRAVVERILAAADVCPTCGQKRVDTTDPDDVGTPSGEVLTPSAIEELRDSLPDRPADRPIVVSREEADRYFGGPSLRDTT